MIQYRIFVTEGHILASVEKYRRQQKIRPWVTALKAVCAIGLSILLSLVIYGASRVKGNGGPLLLLGLVPLAFLWLLFQSHRLDYWFIKRRLRRSPFYEDEVRVGVSEAGVSVQTPRSEAVLQWPAFSRVLRLKDGFLVFTGPAVFDWWPDLALCEGSTSELESLFEQNVQGYERFNA